MGKVRSIDDRIEDMEMKIRELKAKKAGGTLMGTKAEESAFRKALKARKGFGLSYAELLGALEYIASRVSGVEHDDRRRRLAESGQTIMDEYLKPIEPEATEASDDAPGAEEDLVPVGN
ncbi:hypothetical protein JKG47_00915 [Acidithiobacillus sp. MC6.1]|nr:hypothetical protein [Acidithiobacillus sp. MC6.1]